MSIRKPRFEYISYSGWKRAVIRYWGRQGNISFYGDKDIGGAQLTNPFSGIVRQVGEWDGEKGEVFD
jgi:hypothetical protein